MLIIAFLIAGLNMVSSAPILSGAYQATPLTIFGRQLPDCVNVTRYRTRQGIIWGCLATIFSCTWVAVHPNVPSSYDSGWTKFKRRIFIMIYAILAPEFIIMWAPRQRIGAARHTEEYNKKFYPDVTLPPPSIYRSILSWFYGHENETPDRRWTITHGFLLEMHGLTHDWGKPVQYVEVYVSGISDPVDIPEEELHDKSKGDFLTKTLVVLQTSWFMFQCTARWIQHLPVTELEVITLAFALLNIGTYILWWNKPQNMHVAIPMARYMRPNHPEEEKGATTGSAMQGTSSDPEKCEDMGGIEASAEPYFGEGTGVPASRSLSQLARLKGLQEGERGKVEVEEENVGAIGSASLPSTSLGTTRVQKSRFPWSVGRATRRYTRGAWAVIRMVGIAFHPRHLRSLEFQNITEFLMGPIRPLMAMLYRVKFAPHTFYASVKGTESWKTNLPMCIISTLFGGLHLIPVWFSTFPSSPEKILWEISAIWITVEPFLLLCTWVLSVSHTIKKHKALRTLADSLFGFVVVVGGLLYVIARLLVVLAFTALRDLPPDTYQNIAWTTFLPHFD